MQHRRAEHGGRGRRPRQGGRGSERLRERARGIARRSAHAGPGSSVGPGAGRAAAALGGAPGPRGTQGRGRRAGGAWAPRDRAAAAEGAAACPGPTDAAPRRGDPELAGCRRPRSRPAPARSQPTWAATPAGWGCRAATARDAADGPASTGRGQPTAPRGGRKAGPSRPRLALSRRARTPPPRAPRPQGGPPAPRRRPPRVRGTAAAGPCPPTPRPCGLSVPASPTTARSGAPARPASGGRRGGRARGVVRGAPRGPGARAAGCGRPAAGASGSGGGSGAASPGPYVAAPRPGYPELAGRRQRRRLRPAGARREP